MKKNILILGILILISTSCAKKKIFLDYGKNATMIDSIVKHFNTIKPDNYDMFLQFGEDDKIDIILWNNGKIDKKLENKIVLDDYGLRLKSQKLDSILNLIHFKQEYLIRLKHDLAEINCESIGYKHKLWHIHNSVGAIEIGYITHDFYGLDYIITDTIDQDFLKEAKEMCNYKIINNKVLVRFQGPSWGDDGGVNWCSE